MESIKDWMLGIVSAALICAAATSLIKSGDASGKMAKMLLGLFMALAVFQPMVDIRFDDIWQIGDEVWQQGQSSADTGKNAASHAWAEGIKASAEAYILDKAKNFDAQLTVNVTVDASSPPRLNGVQLSGQVSPYARKLLGDIIANELGIAEEDQQWNC